MSYSGGVHIDAFNLPANDPAGGITLELATTITNPSSVGISLDSILFANSYGQTVIGPAQSVGAFNLLPKATFSIPLVGRLVPQTSSQGLADVSTLFNGFIHGVPSDLIVAGQSTGPVDCTWLNTGIKSLKIAVILPAALNLQVINSIQLNQLSLIFDQATPWSPLFSTTDTIAAFQLPFAFPVDITHIQTSITAASNSGGSRKRAIADFATLDVPLVPATTDVVARKIALVFNNVPFTSIDNDVFSSFLLDVTQSANSNLGLHGTANTVTATAVGNINLADIGFSVSTPLLGLQGLNAQPATVTDLDVARGFSNYLQINGKNLYLLIVILF